MKNWFLFFLVCVLLVVPVYATDYTEELIYEEEDSIDTLSDQDVGQTDDTVYVETEAELSVVDSSDDVSGDSGISTLSINPVTSADTTGLKSVLLEVLGDYDAIIVEYTSGNYTSREVFQDDVWLCSFWLLAIMVYCVFKLLGGWLVRKQ